MWTPRVESAPRRRVNRTGLFTYDFSLWASLRWIGARDGGEKSLGVWMQGLAKQVSGGCCLDDLSGVHHGDAIAHVAYDIDVVTDEDRSEPKVLLEPTQEVEHLSLD